MRAIFKRSRREIHSHKDKIWGVLEGEFNIQFNIIMYSFVDDDTSLTVLN